jgi:AraC family transcriptional regulator
MRHIDAIEHAIAFTEAHLREDIGVRDMAAAVAYSLYHFCRTFNQVTHHTPYDYLIRRRLAEAARDLLQHDRHIGDIAADYYFNSPETFARAFRRIFGMLPTHWRTQGALDPHLLMPRLTRAHLQYVQHGITRSATLEPCAALHLAGVMTLVHTDRAAITQLQAAFDADLAAIDPERLWAIHAVRIYPPRWTVYGFYYLLGVACGAPEPPPPAWVRTSLPAGTCACFAHQAGAADVALGLDYIYHTWLPQSGYRRAQPWVSTRIRWRPGDPDPGPHTIAVPITHVVQVRG